MTMVAPDGRSEHSRAELSPTFGRDERDERRGCPHRVPSESSVALLGAAWRSTIRHGNRFGAVSDRKEPWRSLDVRRDSSCVPVRPLGWSNAPGEGLPYHHARVVQRLQHREVLHCVARLKRCEGRPLGDVPEGFYEREESMRPRASLHVAQN